MSIAIKRNFTIPSTSAIGASEIYITSSVASTSVGTGSLQVAGGAGISGTLSLGGVLKLFNDSYYTGFDSAATANTTYIWPATSPATGTSVLSSDAAGNLSWVLMSASGSGLTLNGLTSSTQYFSTSISGSGFTVSSIGSTHTFYIGLAGNASTGLISSASQTLFGLKTFASGVAITAGIASTNTTTGDLVVSGGVGIGDSLFVANGIAVNSGTSGLLLRKLVAGNYGAIYSTGVTPSSTNYSMITDGASVNFNGTSGVYFNISNSNKIQVTTNNINIVPTAGSSSTSTGALTIAGGVGIGGSLWTSSSYYSSISGVGISNGVITGSLTGTATSAAQINIDASTGTRYLVGTLLNTASGSTQLSTGSGITIGNNIITATTFAGNATSSTTSGASGKWITSRTITFATGDVTGSFSLDGSADVSNVALTIGANAVALGTDTTGNYVGTVSTSGNGISTIGSAGEGTTFTIDSNATSNNTASTIVFRDSSGNFSAGTISASLTGTASIATSAANLNTVTDTSSTLYLIGSRSSTGIASTQIYVDTNISFSGNTITATTFSGTATSALNTGTQNTVSDTTSTIYFTGSRLSTGTAATTSYVLSGVSALGNTLTATTFSGSLSGTASTSTNLVTSLLSGTMYLTGQASSSAASAGTSQLVGSGLSFVSSTGTLTAAFFVGSGNQLSGIVTSLAAGSGISINASSGPVTIYNSGVVSLTGTSNQVLVGGASGTATSGNITLTLPQSIGTASSPSFADITLSTGTNSTIASVGSQPTSIVNKQYVDNLAAGLDIHASVRVLQSSAFTANYVQTQSAGSASTGSYLISTTQVALPAIDGISISATGTTQRVLVTSGFTGTASIAGTTPFTPGNSNIANGIYYVGALGGSGTSNWILVRATDTDDNIELTAGTFCFIEEGTSYGDSGWVCTNDTTNNGPIIFGSTAITFSQFTGGAALAVGQGLNKVGSTIATNVKLSSTGTASGTGFTQFNIGGASLGGVADTGFYPTFSVRTSGNVAGTSILTLNSDGFSLIGSTNTNRTLTVTGSDITLTGGGNTLTLTGSISLPSPTLNGIAYGSSSSAISFLTSSGSGASILSQTTGSAPVYLGQSQLVVGGATTSAQWQTSRTVTFATGDVTGSFSLNGSADVSNVALTIAANSVALGTDTTGNYAASVLVSGNGLTIGGAAGEATDYTIYSNATSSNTASSLVFRDASGNFSAGTITATTFSGTASSSALINIDASTGTRYLVGTILNTASGSTQLSTGSGITIGNNVITATTFQGTATSSNNAANTNITLDTTSTIYLTGSRSNASIGSTPVYVLSGISALGNTITATTFSGNATTATTSGAAGKWTTSRTVTFATGDVTGSFSLDGSADVSNVALTIAANSIALGTDTTGNYAASISTSGNGISTIGTAGEGTAFTIDSNATSSNTVSTIVFRDGSGNFSAGTITASLTGTASIATSAASLNTVTDTSSTLYLLGSRSSTGIASTQVYVDTNISFSGSTITATTFSGTASSALNAGTANIVGDTSNTIYFTGSRSNSSIGATAIYVLSGVSALGNTITATTFSGTATSSTNTANTNITLDTTSTIYLTGSRSNASIGSTPVYVLSGVSALGNTITATTFSGTASSAALVNVAASTATRYLAAVSLNTAAGSTQIFTGSGITIGDNRLTVGGLAVTSGTASTNTTTGALTVNGGVGITGQLSINTMALGSTGVAFTPSIVFAGSAGTVITMSVLSDTTLAWEGSSGQLFSIDNNLSTGEIFSVSDISGLPLISASAGQTVTLNEFGGFTQVGNGLASTSTSTGALRVIGGIGITGNAYVGGVINANAGTNSTSTTTGAVIINGGIGVTGNAYVGGVINANAGTNSTSNTSGAVVINGGLGITGNANIGGTFNANNGTNSTSTTTGSLVVNGGIGATGNIYVGGAINANAGTNSTSTTTGAVIINGGLGVTGNSNIGGTVRVTNTTAATGNSSAAFTVAGGAGIGQSLFVAGNFNLTGSVFAGTNTYTKTLGSGDIALDNGSVDSPAILFYWGNNRNMGIDTFYSGSGTTKFRIVKELNESGGGEVWSVDRNGIVTRTAWSPGETINTAMYNYSDLGMASTTTISSTSYTTFATVTYTPKSSSSYLWIEFSCTYTVSGTTGDDFWSNIEVAGSEIVNSNQVWTGQVGGGTRSGVMFPLAARYTNTGTAGIAISVRSKRGTSDDNATIYGNTASGFMRIQEIGR